MPRKGLSYRHHKPTGLAFIEYQGKRTYLGKYDSPESHEEYARIKKQIETTRPVSVARGPAPFSLTMTELLNRFWEFADQHYRKNGRPTSEIGNLTQALRLLRQLYGPTIASDFGPLDLHRVRNEMVEKGRSRNLINKDVSRIRGVFRWGVEFQLIPPAVLQALQAVVGLRHGRTAARETAPVRPVPDAMVDVIREHVSRQVWAMVELQRLTGMRPGEVVIMRTCDLDVTGRLWTYKPESHKTEHHGHGRMIYFGPKGQEVLRPWLRTDLQAYLFQPKEAETERLANKAAAKSRRRANVKLYRFNQTVHRCWLCKGEALRAGLCPVHYQQWCQAGRPDRKQWVKGQGGGKGVKLRAAEWPSCKRCGRPARWRGFCQTCYDRWRRAGQPADVDQWIQATADKPCRRIAAPADRYDVNDYRKAIQRACIIAWNREQRVAGKLDLVAKNQSAARKLGVPIWHPHQLRHSTATQIRKEFGLDAARAVLGHRSTAITEVYAELDGAKAAEVMLRIG